MFIVFFPLLYIVHFHRFFVVHDYLCVNVEKFILRTPIYHLQTHTLTPSQGIHLCAMIARKHKQQAMYRAMLELQASSRECML